ncbi:MAG TPA: aminoglycoside phosphotransferase family protein [Candidatus Limnocylindria bacterium]|nr:aminoglycoside phosphotransferase family protein [Candidatus Limnocylindria bacterium]
MATKTDHGETQRDFLRERFGPGAQIEVIRPGEWSVAYSVKTADADLVARFSEYDEDFEKDAYAARYSSTALPIPPILQWGPALDGFYAVAPRMNGEHIDGLDEPRMRRVLPSLFAALDAMREVDLQAASGFGGWRADGRTSHPSWREWLLRFVDEPATRGAPGWRELLRDSPTEFRSFEEGYLRLVELAEPCPEVRHLFHDDLINRNVLVDDDRISAVLDWGSSKYGDFLFDIANLVFYTPWFPQWRNIDFAAEALAHYKSIGLAVPNFAERLRCYTLRIALDGIAYSAFRKRWGEVELRARRALEIARA